MASSNNNNSAPFTASLLAPLPGCFWLPPHVHTTHAGCQSRRHSAYFIQRRFERHGRRGNTIEEQLTLPPANKMLNDLLPICCRHLANGALPPTRTCHCCTLAAMTQLVARVELACPCQRWWRLWRRTSLVLSSVFTCHGTCVWARRWVMCAAFVDTRTVGCGLLCLAYQYLGHLWGHPLPATTLGSGPSWHPGHAAHLLARWCHCHSHSKHYAFAPPLQPAKHTITGT